VHQPQLACIKMKFKDCDLLSSAATSVVQQAKNRDPAQFLGLENSQERPTCRLETHAAKQLFWSQSSPSTVCLEAEKQVIAVQRHNF
jgi:hypothetical protein